MDPRHDHLNKLLDPKYGLHANSDAEPGLIIPMAYVWDHEAQSGQEEGARIACVIALRSSTFRTAKRW